MRILTKLIRGYISSFGLILFLPFVCSNERYPASPYYYLPNDCISDSFNIDAIKEGNIDSVLLSKAADEIRLGKYGEVHSMIIYKDDKIVFEEYFPGHQYKWDGPNHHGEWMNWDRAMPHGVKSVSKSIVSLCVGIAIDKGFIKRVDQSVFDYLPGHEALKNGGKEKITIGHLLSMTSGLEWEEWKTSLSNEKNDIVNIWFQDKDPLTYILEKPLIKEPGTNFNYSGGNTILLGEIIRNATKMDLEEFANEYLFKPLGIDSTDWNLRYANGVIEAGGGLEITPVDLAKIGVLCLNKGTFNGQQIIAENWLAKCYTPYSNNTNILIPGHFSGSHGYAYSWWLKSFKRGGEEINLYHATGWGGQELIVIPALNAVIVFTGGNYVPLTTTFSILDKYILPALLPAKKN